MQQACVHMTIILINHIHSKINNRYNYNVTRNDSINVLHFLPPQVTSGVVWQHRQHHTGHARLCSV